MEMLSCYTRVTHFPPGLTYREWQFLLDPSGWEVMVRWKHVAQGSCKQQESRELWRIWNVTQDAFLIFTGISVTIQREPFPRKSRSVMESLLSQEHQNSHYEPVLCKRTSNLNHTLRHTGTHFRLRIKSHMFLFKTRSWRTKCQSLGQSPQMPNKVHISCTWESQWISAHSSSQCLCVSQHILRLN